MCIRTQEKGAVTQQETDPDLPGCVQESPVEAWVTGGLLQGWGHWVYQLHAWDHLKEVTIIFIISTMIRLSQMTLHDMAHNFIELDKVVAHVTRLVSFLWLWFSIYLVSDGEA